ncbi:uncharacterized protein BJ212DRAFT_580277 [Suillus subaureus]|uniref:Transmembrane protein n=1 Tax=Suillus subaureus TaxID=48587 RepID=A0A9P7ASD8_9AGAM|nr:uncharacterized protein BJ212DRAFT_580277 [Suillus subaureus]KAG1795547.1 hypothetical protein BJ212DRAFT_580277 [Suillus subaureus]
MFMETTPNPAMEFHEVTDEERTDLNVLLKMKCKNLLIEIDRLEGRWMMLRFSYLTIVFLPASFIASIFGMNVKEIKQWDSNTRSLRGDHRCAHAFHDLVHRHHASETTVPQMPCYLAAARSVAHSFPLDN